MEKKMLANFIAAAAAVAFVSMPLASIAKADTSEVKCYGVNSCKGQSGCKTAKSSCKGQNACKGQGFMMEGSDDCQKSGGSTDEPKA